HRADLDGVPGERAPEVLAGGDADLFGAAAVEQLDEAIAGDLVAEPRAARAEHAAFAVQVHERRERERLAIGPLRLLVARGSGPECQGLILERALAAAVADGPVGGVV